MQHVLFCIWLLSYNITFECVIIIFVWSSGTLFLNDRQFSIVWTYWNVVIHSTIDETFGTIITKADMNNVVYVFLCLSVAYSRSLMFLSVLSTCFALCVIVYIFCIDLSSTSPILSSAVSHLSCCDFSYYIFQFKNFHLILFLFFY